MPILQCLSGRCLSLPIHPAELSLKLPILTNQSHQQRSSTSGRTCPACVFTPIPANRQNIPERLVDVSVVFSDLLKAPLGEGYQHSRLHLACGSSHSHRFPICRLQLLEQGHEHRLVITSSCGHTMISNGSRTFADIAGSLQCIRTHALEKPCQSRSKL